LDEDLALLWKGYRRPDSGNAMQSGGDVQAVGIDAEEYLREALVTVAILGKSGRDPELEAWLPDCLLKHRKEEEAQARRATWQ